MEGITTACVAFIFVCIIYPNLVKVRAQFYAAFGMIVLIIFFHSLARMILHDGFHRFVGGLTGLLQVVALLMLVLSTGGLSLKQLAGDIKGSYEVVRRGETEAETIIPRSTQATAPPVGPTAVPPPPPPPRGSGSIPIE